MANKKLKVGGGENLKLPAKKDKTAAKKPKWQAKIGGRKGGEKVETVVEPVGETPQVVESGVVADSPVLASETTETPVVATTPEAASVEATATYTGATTPDFGAPAQVPATTAAEVSTITNEPTPAKKPASSRSSRRTAQEAQHDGCGAAGVTATQGGYDLPGVD